MRKGGQILMLLSVLRNPVIFRFNTDAQDFKLKNYHFLRIPYLKA